METHEQVEEWEHFEDMEKETFIDRLTVSYEGKFEWAELTRMIEKWGKEHEYFVHIDAHKGGITTSGRNLAVEYNLFKKFSQIHYSVLKLEVSCSNMKDIVEKVDGRNRNINEGSVEAVFMGFLMTNIKSRWETKPSIYFIRGVIDKFIYKLYRPKYPGRVIGDATTLANEIRSFLYLYKHRLGEGMPDERIPTAIDPEEQEEKEGKEEDKDKEEGEQKPEDKKEEKPVEEPKPEDKQETSSEEKKNNKIN